MPSAPKWLFDVVERLSAKLPPVEVTDTELLSPFVKKIRFKGDFASLDFQEGYCIDFRVTDTDVRRYSPSLLDRENGVLELIVHLHGDGPGRRFMDALKAGEQVNLVQPRGHKYYDKMVAKYVIFGDETSLALACSFNEAFKENPNEYYFLFELDDENKNVPNRLGLTNYTVFPKIGLFQDANWITELPQLQSTHWLGAHFILTGDVLSVQAFRKVLKGFATGKVHAQGYWLKGKKGL